MTATPNVLTPKQFIELRLRRHKAEVAEELLRWPDDGSLPVSQVRVFLLRVLELLDGLDLELRSHPDE